MTGKLPSLALPRSTVTLPDGTVLEVRGLSRGEAMRAVEAADTGSWAAVERLLLSLGTDTPKEEADAWYDASPTEAVKPILDEVMKISGLEAGAMRPTNAG